MFELTANNDLLISNEHFSLSSHVTVGFSKFLLCPIFARSTRAPGFTVLFFFRSGCLKNQPRRKKEINYENERVREREVLRNLLWTGQSRKHGQKKTTCIIIQFAQ